MKRKPIFRGLLWVLLTGVLFLLLPSGAEAREEPQWNLYFGLLHAHTDISDGKGTVEEAFSAAAGVEGLDFFAVTDHSNSFDNGDFGAIGLEGGSISSDWAKGKAAAAAVTDGRFVGIFGYEMTWRDSDGLGHINTFGTPGWISRNQPGYESLTDYYDALTTVPDSVSQFNHPGPESGDFQNFSHHSEVYDGAISLLEVGGEHGFRGYSAYETALKKGWHVAPTNSHNNHSGQWGTAGESRTVILAPELTEESLYEAMRQRRVYATEDRDLEILYRLNGQIMGSAADLTETIIITAEISDPTDSAIGTVEVRTGGKTVATKTVDVPSDSVTFILPGSCGYYYLRITQPDGDTAVTAPVWVEEGASQPQETNPTQPEETAPEETKAPEETEPAPTLPEDLELAPCFGLLHSHSEISGGQETVEDLFRQAAAAEHMDFFAVTDSSQSFDNGDAGTIDADGCALSRDWARGKAAAEAVTGETFTGLYGYEMAWPDDRNLGHITTFGTSGWISRNREGYENLTDYYDALTHAPGSVSQFNHPGPDIGEFENFLHHRASYDDALSLLEIGDGTDFAFDSKYIRALDQGWHVAPAAGEADPSETLRTVILTEENSEEGLLSAMKRRQVYATRDWDLSLYFTLDDVPMGAVTNAGDEHTLCLFAADPTDPGPGTVEVITDGGAIAATGEWISGEPLQLTVPGGGSYYFLRLTQEDGDSAITAPVWTDSYEDVGISTFTSRNDLPMQGEEITLEVTLYNEETATFRMEDLQLSVNGTPVSAKTEVNDIPPGETLTFSIPYTHPLPGVTEFQVDVEGSVGGIRRSLRETMTISFRAREMVAGILVECGCSGLSSKDFQNLSALAARDNMQVHFFSGDLPDQGNVLILPPPQMDYSPEFLLQVKIFCARGGSLAVCGCSGEENPEAIRQLNRVLETVGSTMRLLEDTALDKVHNGGKPEELYPDTINRKDAWCAEVQEGAFYIHSNGCTLSPGSGTWLVKGKKTTVSSLTGQSEPVLLAWEELPRGGCIFAAGTLFPGDDSLPLPENRWAIPRVNLTLTESILGVTRIQLPLTDIADVRSGKTNTLYRIRGYATSGTSNPFTTFPDTLYVQDKTGGIPLVSFRDGGIQVGQSIDAVGYLDERKRNPVLVLVDYRQGEDGMYRFVPDTLNHSRAMDFEARGGQLLQVEAEVISVTLTEDGQGVKRFTLVDSWGDEATVLIEDHIRSGAYGDNTLASQVKIGRNVRAMGLLHLDENGIPVLRVRNCEEVVWVPPVPHPDAAERSRNPYTGDRIGPAYAVSLASAFLLLILRKHKK